MLDLVVVFNGNLTAATNYPFTSSGWISNAIVYEENDAYFRREELRLKQIKIWRERARARAVPPQPPPVALKLASLPRFPVPVHCRLSIDPAWRPNRLSAPRSRKPRRRRQRPAGWRLNK